MKSFPLYRQLDAMDCGPTCLRMVAKYYGRSISLDYLRNRSQYGKQGVSMLGLADAAESIGLKSAGVKHSIDQLIRDTPLLTIIQKESRISKSKVSAYRIKNLTMARILTIDKIVLLNTNTNIHLIISALHSATSAFISDLKAKFLYKSSLNMAISCVIICCLFSGVFNACAMYQIYVFKAK